MTLRGCGEGIDLNMKKSPPNREGGAGLGVLTTSFLLHNRFIKRFLSRFLSNAEDIEDVTQETFLRAYAAVEQRQQALPQPKAFLFRIAKNLAINELRRKSRQMTDYLEECNELGEAESHSAEAEVEGMQSLALYCEAVAGLSDKCRKVYLLRKVHGLSHSEIAEQLSLSLSSVEKYIARGALHCRSFLHNKERDWHYRQQPSQNPTGHHIHGGKSDE